MPPALRELQRRGAAPLTPGADAGAERLSVAIVLPSFRPGSGGHGTLVRLARGLQEQGHQVSLWLEDSEGWHRDVPPPRLAAEFAGLFDAESLPLHADFGGWEGADVAVATGWQTVARVLLLEGTRARAYLVQDHEPDFYPASAQSLWAQQSYRAGLRCIAASGWLAELLRARYGAAATHFDLGADGSIYRAADEAARREDLVVFYARSSTPRRAVPLGLAALGELATRRPDVEIGLFGHAGGWRLPFPHRDLGALVPGELATLYGRAALGMVLSLTNPSLVGLEMLACGLPCVELASESMLATFGAGGPLALAEPDPLALCARLESLLDDRTEREQRRRAGLELARARTWERASQQVADGLRAALAEAAAA
jgi:glycosyltransferase involved in cell wall biosynthesis